jgi:hypothetical protein
MNDTTKIRQHAIAVVIARRLNRDKDSPFRGLIKTPWNPRGIVHRNIIVKMVEQSISRGTLGDFKETFDVEEGLLLFVAFWWAVKMTFHEAWYLPPRVSRLMHPTGILALGQVMDESVARHREKGRPSFGVFVRALSFLAPFCRWTQGAWSFGNGEKRPWNSLQATPNDVDCLGAYLVGLYRRLAWLMRK